MHEIELIVVGENHRSLLLTDEDECGQSWLRKDQVEIVSRDEDRIIIRADYDLLDKAGFIF